MKLMFNGFLVLCILISCVSCAEVNALCDIFNNLHPANWSNPCEWSYPCEDFLAGVTCNGANVETLY